MSPVFGGVGYLFKKPKYPLDRKYPPDPAEKQRNLNA
jgi:hypothetical protein